MNLLGLCVIAVTGIEGNPPKIADMACCDRLPLAYKFVNIIPPDSSLWKFGEIPGSPPIDSIKSPA